MAEGEELDLAEQAEQFKELEQYIIEAGNTFFVDEEGTVYYLDNEADSKLRSTCKHDYVNGTSANIINIQMGAVKRIIILVKCAENVAIRFLGSI